MNKLSELSGKELQYRLLENREKALRRTYEALMPIGKEYYTIKAELYSVRDQLVDFWD